MPDDLVICNGTKYCTPEIDTSEIIVDVSGISQHISPFNCILSFSQWICDGNFQWTFSDIFRWNFTFVISGVCGKAGLCFVVYRELAFVLCYMLILTIFVYLFSV